MERVEKMSRDPRLLVEAHEILSCLVAQVYAFDEGQYESACEVWKTLGYDLDGVRFWSKNPGCRIPVWRTCEIRAMVFRCRDVNAFRYLPNGDPRPWQLPKYVIAIRGTKPCKVDIRDDLRIAFETLHTSSFFEDIKNQIKDVVEKHKARNVCVTGHSLGAAFGLLATRHLALEGTVLETHLFNPPFLSIDTLLKKGWNGVKSLVAASSSRGASMVKKGFNWVMESDRDAKLLRDNDEEFRKLQIWTPNLYVNKHDPICNGYIDHFEKLKDHPEKLCRSMSSFSRFIRKVTPIEAYSYHLIPKTNLFVNDTIPSGNKLDQRSSKKLVTPCSHALDVWHGHPKDMNLHRQEYDLLQHDMTWFYKMAGFW